VCPCLEVEPPQAWDYWIFLNFRTLVILLSIDPTSNNEPKIIYNFFFEIEDIWIFAWSSIPNVGHYH
jgi:hypothetical protein